MDLDEEYDVIILGTGLTKCILSGLFSTQGKKVLHLESNSYYGGDCGSLNFEGMWNKFNKDTPIPNYPGRPASWSIDLTPKFVMATGDLVKILKQTGVSRYLEWRLIEGTFVYQHQPKTLFSKEKFIHKVPSTAGEAASSPLMGFVQKNRAASFFSYLAEFDENNSSTHKGLSPTGNTTRDILKHFKLDTMTSEFVLHAIALSPNEKILDSSLSVFAKKMKLYFDSVTCYGKSPFIYPLYGLGTLPEAFSRLAAVYGGTYMLNANISEYKYDSDGKFCGMDIIFEGEKYSTKSKLVISDASYVKNFDPVKTRCSGKIIKSVCVLSHPIPGTESYQSCGIIIPQNQLGRKSDVYVMELSHDHRVVPEGKYLSIVSTTVETESPENEIKPALNLLGNIDYQFTYTCDSYVPTDPIDVIPKDGIIVCHTIDASSHLESVIQEVHRIYRLVMGKPLDLTGVSTNLDHED